MTKRRPQENVHHLVSQCLRPEYNVDIEQNKLKMNIKRHDALHALYNCLHTPKEQLLESYYLYENVLSHTAKKLFRELLRLEDKDFYIPELIKWKKKNHKLVNERD